jgi:predicted lipoprotein with Yx(FWY)xxD motif
MATNASLHRSILVDQSGATLYYLTGETATHLLCTSRTCLKFWPPLYLPAGATTPSALHGVSMSKLGTVKRAGGKLQVTYNGWPLYTFAGDAHAGDAKGENVKSDGGTWLVIPGGSSSNSTPPPATSSGGSSSSGGGWS